MDHLREYIKGWIEFHKSERDCWGEIDEEMFEMVMEDVVSSVELYNFTDYTKED